jgi:hypothetical protein
MESAVRSAWVEPATIAHASKTPLLQTLPRSGSPAAKAGCHFDPRRVRPSKYRRPAGASSEHAAAGDLVSGKATRCTTTATRSQASPATSRSASSLAKSPMISR